MAYFHFFNFFTRGRHVTVALCVCLCCYKRIELWSRRYFLPARRYASAGQRRVRTSVRLSVRHTPVLCLVERKQDREMYTF